MEKSHLFAYLRFCACEEKKIEKSLKCKYTKTTDVPTALFMQAHLTYMNRVVGTRIKIS